MMQFDKNLKKYLIRYEECDAYNKKPRSAYVADRG